MGAHGVSVGESGKACVGGGLNVLELYVGGSGCGGGEDILEYGCCRHWIEFHCDY